MIVYHPIQDSYHCALRLITIVLDGEFQDIEWERMKLLDFYVALPHLLAQVRLPAEYRSMKIVLKKLPEPYESLLNPIRLFFQMEEVQESAARLLTACGIIDNALFLHGTFSVTESKLVGPIRRIAEKVAFRREPWYRFLVHDLGRYPLHGRNGLKDRTGIMEFRHDVA